jgi:hypothetical protein
MRRNYISPEFNYFRVFGTLNMVEESSFFGSKMLEIEDSLEINNQNLIYYETLQGEQIDISIENSLQPNVISCSDIKNTNHTLVIDPNQSDFQKNGNTRYLMTIGTDQIFQLFIFGILKQYRTFEGVLNNMTFGGNVNSSIKEYIIKNISNRYKFDRVEVYLNYRDLRDQNILRFANEWNPNIGDSLNKISRIETETEFDSSSIRVTFNQEKPSSLYNFEYYYKLFWSKI